MCRAKAQGPMARAYHGDFGVSRVQRLRFPAASAMAARECRSP